MEGCKVRPNPLYLILEEMYVPSRHIFRISKITIYGGHLQAKIKSKTLYVLLSHIFGLSKFGVFGGRIDPVLKKHL